MSDVTSAHKIIPPSQLKPLCDAIGDQFDFSQLDAILYLCFSNHKINDYASDRQPRHEVAYACVTGLEREGLVLVFLATILGRIAADSALYKLIIAALPEAAQAIPKLE